MWSLQLFEGCLQSVRTDAQLSRGRERSATNVLYHSSVTAQGRNQGVGSSSCCATRQCRSLWKSTCPETANPWTNASKDAEAPSTRFQGKKELLVAQQQAAQTAFGKAEADESRIRAELAELEQQALSQTTQPTCLSDHLLQSGSTECCGDRTLPSHASDRSICHTNRSRWSSLPHCPSSVESITCRGGGFRHLRLGLRRRRFGPRYTRRRLSRHNQARLKRRCAGNAPYGQTSHQSKTMFGCADGERERGERFPWLRRKAQQDDGDVCRVVKHRYT